MYPFYYLLIQQTNVGKNFGTIYNLDRFIIVDICNLIFISNLLLVSIVPKPLL